VVKPKILIQVFCKNSSESLEKCLSNFDYLDYPRDRIRIVISYSWETTDNTLHTLIKFFKDRNFEVEIYGDVFDCKGNQHWISPLHEASKLLVKDEDFIIHIDDDIIDFSPDLINRLIKVNKDIVAPYVYAGNLSSIGRTDNIFWDTHVFKTLDGKSFPSRKPPRQKSKRPFRVNSVGCCVCFKREVYLKSSFVDNPTGISPPTQWLVICENARRLGYKVFALPYEQIYHIPVHRWSSHLHTLSEYPKITREDWKIIWSQKYYERPELKKKNKKKHHPRYLKCPKNQRPCIHCGTCNHASTSRCKKCGRHPKK